MAATRYELDLKSYALNCLIIIYSLLSIFMGLLFYGANIIFFAELQDIKLLSDPVTPLNGATNEGIANGLAVHACH